MEDISKDPFPEYTRQREHDRSQLANAWYTAIGLQAVDRLETSAYLQKTAKDSITLFDFIPMAKT